MRCLPHGKKKKGANLLYGSHSLIASPAGKIFCYVCTQWRVDASKVRLR